jgi:hypothetical protein
MVRFAYVDLGLSIDEFYGLSFYEWALEIERVKKRAEDNNKEWEGHAFLTREFMALMANINRNSKKKPVPFEGKDFIKLSFDKEYESRVMTPEEVEAKFKKFEKKFKDGS